MRKIFLFTSLISVLLIALGSVYLVEILWLYVIVVPLIILGFIDFFQKRKAIRRNYPVLGRFRYIFEAIRPEINQYFVESNTDGKPFSREQRSVVYQRAKLQLDTLPFGTQKDVYEVGYEWVNHSTITTHVEANKLRCTVGGKDCKKPYSASVLNISAMSYGSLSSRAVEALNGGAKDNNFAHNTGEGGISPYHKNLGGDLIWQIGTGYFGCRNSDGTFDVDKFSEKAKDDQVKMIEIKISQGAKPGHGGILPGEKVDEEVAAIRGVEIGKDVLSPPSHSAFSTPKEMVEFIRTLREASGGKPIGIKLCVGKRREFISMVKAMNELDCYPDYVAVDGGEGGTGAAPIEFSNHIGAPGVEGLIFVHNVLRGFGVRDQVKVMATGRVTTAFGMIKRLALGADMIYSARAMMMALGCIQALRCNSNHCPAGVATQDPNLVEGLVVSDKRRRVANFHRETVGSLAHMLEAMGLNDTKELRPWHIMRRVAHTKVKHYGELTEYIDDGSLLNSPLPRSFERAFKAASSDSFRAVE